MHLLYKLTRPLPWGRPLTVRHPFFHPSPLSTFTLVSYLSFPPRLTPTLCINSLSYSCHLQCGAIRLRLVVIYAWMTNNFFLSYTNRAHTHYRQLSIHKNAMYLILWYIGTIYVPVLVMCMKYSVWRVPAKWNPPSYLWHNSNGRNLCSIINTNPDTSYCITNHNIQIAQGPLHWYYLTNANIIPTVQQIPLLPTQFMEYHFVRPPVPAANT